MACVTCYLAYIAYAYLAYKVLMLAYSLVKPCIRFGPNLKKRYGKGYAVVTGGTGGLGLGYAEEFARRGINVLLVSRTESKLKACQADLKKKYPTVEVDYVTADFSNLQPDIIAVLQDKFDSLEISCLVNNCGISYHHAERLTDIDDALVDRLIEINVRSLTIITRMILPQMIQRKKGDIINVTSADGTMQTGAPFYAVYSGTKGYVALFSKSLAHENKGTGVSVQCHVPFYVATAMSKQKASWPLVPTPKAWARSAVNCIGESTCVITPNAAHNALDVLINSLPESIAANYIAGHNKHIRKRALRKKAILAFEKGFLEAHPEYKSLDEAERRRKVRAAFNEAQKKKS